MPLHVSTNLLINTDSLQWQDKEQLTSNRVRPVFPKNGSGVGPGIPSFLNTVNGSTQYLKIKGKLIN